MSERAIRAAEQATVGSWDTEEWDAWRARRHEALSKFAGLRACVYVQPTNFEIEDLSVDMVQEHHMCQSGCSEGFLPAQGTWEEFWEARREVEEKKCTVYKTDLKPYLKDLPIRDADKPIYVMSSSSFGHHRSGLEVVRVEFGLIPGGELFFFQGEDLSVPAQAIKLVEDRRLEDEAEEKQKEEELVLHQANLKLADRAEFEYMFPDLAGQY